MSSYRVKLTQLPEKQRLKFGKSESLSAVKKKAPNRALRFGKEALHRKIGEQENGNAGVEAAHGTERAASSISRTLQKKRIKKQYLYNYNRKTRKYIGKIRKTADFVKTVVRTAAKSPAATGIVLGGLFFICLVSSLAAPVSIIGGGGAVFLGTYPAEEKIINNALLFYSELETEYILMLNDLPKDYPGYSEYRYSMPGIKHNPHELISFLSAYYGEFTEANAENALKQIFGNRYKLSLTESTETHNYTVTLTDESGNPYTEERTYYRKILNIKVAEKDFNTVIESYFDDERKGLYLAYLDTGGNRYITGNPLDFDWSGSISCNSGFRVHPISGEKDFHKGIDIPLSVGTKLYAAHDGVISNAGYDADGYGSHISVKNDAGLETKYAHCSMLIKNIGDSVKMGDLIALSGNTGQSTGPHLHFEVISNGECLNPVIFSMSKI